MRPALTGLNEVEIEGLGQGDDKNAIRAALARATPDRLLKAAQAMRLGVPHDQIFEISRFDPWFLEQVQGIIDMEERVRAHGLPQDATNLRKLKSMGFSDPRLAELAGVSAKDVPCPAPDALRAPGLQAHRHVRGRVRLSDRLYVLDL